MKTTPFLPLRIPPSCMVDTLEEASRIALRTAGPLKVWRETERGRQELYFYRDLVIHANADGHSGIEAVRRMLADGRAFKADQGRWPAQHTMLIGWSQVLDAARTSSGPVRQSTLQPVRYADEGESTVRLDSMTD